MTKGSLRMSFTLQYPGGNLAVQNEMELLQSEWAVEGIKVTLEAVPFSTLVGNLSEPSKWEMVSGIGIIYGSFPSGDTLFYKLQGLDADLGWNNAEENTLVAATTAPQATAAASLKAFYAYEAYTAKELPAIWLPNNAAWDEVAPNVHGFNAYTDNWVTGIFMPQYWWVSKG